MLLLEANRIEKSYGDRIIIKADQLKVYHGDRIGIVGTNGGGKTTLLKMFANQLNPDAGTVNLFCPFAYIPQLEVLESSEVAPKGKQQWGIPKISSHSLSGGEETRTKIAKALSSDATLIFADEPTSHLDVQGIEKFEKEMQAFQGGVVVISHDQQLLNQVCTSIWEVDNGEIHFYEGNYEEYLKQKQHLKDRQGFEHEQYRKEKQRLEQAALEKNQKSKTMRKTPKRMGNSEARLHKRAVGQKKAKLDRGVKAIESRINQLEKKEKPKTEDEIAFDIHQFKPIHGKTAISFQEVYAKAGDSLLLFNDLNGFIKPGSKVALIGDNGVGKSTLLNMIAQGQDGISIAKPASIGFYYQQLENLDENISILENVKETSRYTEQFIRTILSRLLFKREDVHKQVHMLSGGERVKTALAKVFLGDYNVLLLDEPTNYLDLKTKEALLMVLKVYPGTIVFVSHDRYFVKELASHAITIENKKAMLKSRDQLNKRQEPVKQEEEEANLLKLDLEITEILSKLSIASSKDDKLILDEKYRSLVKNKKQLTERYT
jgi:macrolide transport system ATP-binding/permease protein